MIRLFNVYYPVRTLVLLVVEALVVGSSFLLATLWRNPETSWIVLNVDGGYVKILCVTGIVLLLSHGFDLYDSDSLGDKWDLTFRLLMVLGLVAFSLAAAACVSVLPPFPAWARFSPRGRVGIGCFDVYAFRLAGVVFLDCATALFPRAGVCVGHRRSSAAGRERVAAAPGVGH